MKLNKRVALEIAVRQGNAKRVNALLQMHVYSTQYRRAMLHLAVESHIAFAPSSIAQFTKIVNLMLAVDDGKSVYAKNYNGESLMQVAQGKASLEMIRVLKDWIIRRKVARIELLCHIPIIGTRLVIFTATKKSLRGTTSTKSFNMATKAKLTTMVVMGSTRTGRLGDRVGKFLAQQIKQRGVDDNPGVKHHLDYVDLLPLNMGLLKVPHYYMPAGTAPAELEEMAQRVAKADCYVFISPEYNHSIGPALSNFIDHFGIHAYRCKPSAIAVYSGGPFGGVRAAMQLRALTGEIGCPAIRTLFTVPMAQSALEESGVEIGESGKLLRLQATNMLNELEWTATALKHQRETMGKYEVV